uniref:Uncharacterized protein n=1 Tax=Avena sativa TaxID=4498 RepID=A0ACD5XRP4_AVESA
MMEQQQQMTQWMAHQMLMTAPPGSLPTPPFAFPWSGAGGGDSAHSSHCIDLREDQEVELFRIEIVPFGSMGATMILRGVKPPAGAGAIRQWLSTAVVLVLAWVLALVVMSLYVGPYLPGASLHVYNVVGAYDWSKNDTPSVFLLSRRVFQGDTHLNTIEADPEPVPQGRGRCNLFRGKWFFDSSGPLYTNNSCPLITRTQNCQANGRPDKGYENWRWKPDNCILPRLDARKFLELMRGKTLAFVGDSISRNQMESLLCILWQVDTPINKGNRKMQKWIFSATSTTIIRIWSSWLVHTSKKTVEFAPKGLDKVFLDIPDENFMEFLPSFDVLVLSSGHWFAKRSAYILNGNVVGGQLWWPDEVGQMQMNNIDGFGVSVETCLTAVATNPNFKGIAILRTFSPDHNEGGAWNTNGSCTGQVKPVDGVVRNPFTDTMYAKQISGFKKAIKNSGKHGSKLKLMDITQPFSSRVDGHPGPYISDDPNKKTHRGQDGRPPPQDCLHWCMPGPIDMWNEMLVEIIQRELIE